MPKAARIIIQERVNVTESASSSVSLFLAISLVPLWSIPIFVVEWMNSRVSLYRELRPTPAGPSNSAANLARTKFITILSPCTLPNSVITFSSFLYDESIASDYYSYHLEDNNMKEKNLQSIVAQYHKVSLSHHFIKHRWKR